MIRERMFGTCPRCFQTVPLIWDGTCRPHAGVGCTCGRRHSHAPTIDCEVVPVPTCVGSMYTPLDAEPLPHVHRCSCGVTFEETNQ